MNKKIKLAILVVVVIIAGIGIIFLANPQGAPGLEFPVEETVFKCESSTDCTKVRSGCCGCGGGGTAASINREYSDYWQDILSEECEGMGCPQVVSDHWTCSESAIPICINGKCTLSR